jgi:hypothetical protein
VTSPLRTFGPLDHSHTGWASAALAIGRPAADLSAQGPEAMPVTMSNHTHAEDWFELLTRPLWGLAAAKDAVPDDVWASLAQTLARALDPDDPWYVGSGGGQRVVESAAVGWTLALAPEKIWEPLDGKAKDKVAAWVTAAYQAQFLGSCPRPQSSAQ